VLFDIGMQSGAEDLSAATDDGGAGGAGEDRGDHVQFEASALGRIAGVAAGAAGPAKALVAGRIRRIDRNMFLSLVSDPVAARLTGWWRVFHTKLAKHPRADLLSFRIATLLLL
jgi:hypothetical protein